MIKRLIIRKRTNRDGTEYFTGFDRGFPTFKKFIDYSIKGYTHARHAHQQMKKIERLLLAFNAVYDLVEIEIADWQPLHKEFEAPEGA